jgi:hypothetical protein
MGYDTDPEYVKIAERRVAEAVDPPPPPVRKTKRQPEPPASDGTPSDDFQSRATREGKRAQKLAEDVLEAAGFTIKEQNTNIPKTGVTINFVATDALEETWFFDVSGAFTSHRGGLLRTDTVWKSLGRAAALRGRVDRKIRLVFLTTHLPRRSSEGDKALRSAGHETFFDAVEMLSDADRGRLERYAAGWPGPLPEEGFWTREDLARSP